MTAYRIGFRFMWEQTLAAARAAAIPTDSILDATARVFLAQDTFTQAMNCRLSPTTDSADPRAGGRAVRVGGGTAVATGSPTTKACGRRQICCGYPPWVPMSSWRQSCARSESWDSPTIENKLSVRDIRWAWRLLPDLQVGIVHLRGHASQPPRHACRGAPAGRDRPSRHQSAVSRAGRNQRRAAIRPAGGHRKAVGRLTRRRLRRHPACRRGGQRPGGHGEDQVVGAQGH